MPPTTSTSTTHHRSPNPSASPAKPRAKPGGGAPLTDADILEIAGEAEDLGAVRELTLRGRQLDSFDAFCVRLPSLEALSLSHNRLTSVAAFGTLRQLKSLNVNSNALSSLAGLEQCRGLQVQWPPSLMLFFLDVTW